MELSQQQTVLPDLYEQSFEELKLQMVLIKEIEEDQSYGSGLVMQHKRQNLPLFYAVKTFDVQQAYEKSKEEAAEHLKIRQPTLIKLIKYQTSQHSALCGSLFKINLIFEYTQHSLHEEIEKRKLNKRRFQQEELYFLLDCVLSALISLSSCNIRHGAVQPKNIYVKNNNRQQIYQLTDIRYLTELYEYKRQVMGFTQGCYLSPSLLQELGRRTFNPIYNYEKSEIFSLGVTICEAALLKSIGNIYDMHNFEVSSENIASYILALREHYSPQFADLVKWMLQINETQRCSASDLARDLQKQLESQGSYSFLLLKQLRGQKFEIINDLHSTQKSMSPLNTTETKQKNNKFTPSPIQTTQFTRSVSPQPQASKNFKQAKPKIITPKNKSSTPFESEQQYDSNYIHKHAETYISSKDQKYRSPKHSPNVSPSKYVPPKVTIMNETLNKRLHEFDQELKEIRGEFQTMHRHYQIDHRNPDQSYIRVLPEVMDSMKEDSIPDRQRYLYQHDDEQQDYVKQPIFKQTNQRQNYLPTKSENREKIKDHLNEISEILNPEIKRPTANGKSKHLIIEPLEVDDYFKEPENPKRTYSFQPSKISKPYLPVTHKEVQSQKSPYDISSIKIQTPSQNTHDPYFSESFKQLDYKMRDPDLKEAIQRLQSDRPQKDLTPRRVIHDPEIQARLPQSGLIHMHSSKPSYMNDIFYKSQGRYQR